LAAAYCNWLSEQEGIPKEQWCYERNKEGKFAEGMKLAPDYLKRTGYRLPTEAEWEYACRAGAVTSRYYGESEELLGKYGWYVSNADNRSWPVGSKKPNDLGLFDMHGNVWMWCQDRMKDYGLGQGVIDDNEDSLLVDARERVLRGGAIVVRASLVRSACRYGFVPSSVGFYVGFRPARTFTP
jgi:formylglycine-generating enzyme required for sulfatase activity